jgi:drug/metabolite transporter (DMT)-like permease
MTVTQSPAVTPARWAVITAFASIYIIWGSTYLAIRFAIETIPPFIMLGARFGLAGLLMYVWLRLRGAARPSARQWGTATLVGGLMLCVGTGSVAWAEQSIPSGLAALLITTTPMWMVLLDWLWKGGPRPGRTVVFGLLLGLVGVVVLFDPVSLLTSREVDPLAAAAVLLGALAWAAGSIHGRNAGLPEDPFLSTALQMTAGGAVLAVTGLALGEGRHFDIGAVTAQSFLSWTYLLVFGSFIGFSAFIWLMKHVSAARVSTYAYVNPVVAVFLGWSLAGEVFNTRMAVAVVLLVSAVVLINRRHRRAEAPSRPRRRAARVAAMPGRKASRPALGVPQTQEDPMA